jgi:hypothetical protein
MPSFSDRILESMLDLAWSLWAEMGVSGWARRHTSWMIDPEPLILFTAALRDADARLRDESTDWCIRYGRYVSAARLRRLLNLESPDSRVAFGEYAATVNTHAAVSWSGATDSRDYRPSGRSALETFERPALISLRLRALFGVGARAEIIRAFVAQPLSSPVTADLAEVAVYTKRNVEKELESLRLAGLTRVTRLRGQLRHRLAAPQELLAFVGPSPVVFPRWDVVLRVLSTIRRTAIRAEGLEPAVRAVEARRAIRILKPELERSNLDHPDTSVTGDAFWTAFEQWACQITAKLATGDADLFGPVAHRASSG